MKRWKSLILSLIAVSISMSAYPSSVICADYLPEKIECFLNTHFRGYDIKKLDYDAKEGECEVKYTNGIKVEFDSHGNWKQIETDYAPLPGSVINLLPRVAIEFIAGRYPRRPVVKLKRKSDRYKVKIEGSIELTFDRQGRLLGIDN